MNQKINKSASKHIRQEKARIRREVSDPVKKDEMIKQLYVKFNPVILKETVSEEKPKIQVSKLSSKKKKPKEEKLKKEKT
jgi:hypothetical protein